MTHERFSESDAWELENPQDDLRGRTVLGEDGHSLGRVEDMLVDTSTQSIDAILLDDGREIPAARLDISGDNLRVMEGADDATSGYAPSGYGLDEGADRMSGTATEDRATLPRYEEELKARTESEVTGEVEIGKHVETDQQSIDVPTTREEVQIRRVPVNRAARGDEQAFVDGDTVRVPVTEERVEVSKQPYVAEELEITKQRESDTERVDETVRREEFDIEREGDVEVGHMGAAGRDRDFDEADRTSGPNVDVDVDTETRRR